ncbi:hypothetical protein M4I17_13310 [Enterococcus thailandicus]|uniref:hypothetical protein n=1 Tax=Enterococcus thailandicus TaxID=417368 RepID=UPI002542BEC2|nr:hypothetical protein [Enterococcus thailandicus]MDK4353369.1 hypothetical protein [Enterococcus thailandicus]
MSELTKIIDDLKVAISSGNQHGLIDLNLLLKRLEKLNVEPQINDNQKIVLEWLQEHLNEDSDPLGVICGMQKFGLQDESIFDATFPMNDQEQFEILLAFAQWGLKQEETE